VGDNVFHPAHLRFNQLPLVLPVVFALHCIEEFPTFISFGDSHGIILPPSNSLELIAAMAGFLLVIAVLSLLAHRAQAPGDWRMTLWMVFFAAIFLHAVLNVGGSLWLREYASGAVVSACLYLPGGIYLFRRALREGWLSPLRLGVIMGLGLVLYAGLAVGLIAAGKAIRGIP
jgi:hypothetical protein